MKKNILKANCRIRKIFVSEYMRGDFFERFISEKELSSMLEEDYVPPIFVKKKLLCSITKYSKSCSNLLGLSRFYSKKFAETGVMPGVTKLS